MFLSWWPPAYNEMSVIHIVYLGFCKDKITVLEEKLEMWKTTEVCFCSIIKLDYIPQVVLSLKQIWFSEIIIFIVVSFSLFFQQFPSQIVGFVPRKHVSSPSGIYSYGSFELQVDSGPGDVYSLILIGAAFFHKDYLKLFQEQPTSIHNMIDQTQNCDDIAMNFLVANSTGKASGVLVKPIDMRNLEKDAGSGYTGMWHRPEHLLQRSYCLNKLVGIYGKMPLRYSNIMISQFGFPNYANHKSKWWRCSYVQGFSFMCTPVMSKATYCRSI